MNSLRASALPRSGIRISPFDAARHQTSLRVVRSQDWRATNTLPAFRASSHRVPRQRFFTVLQAQAASGKSSKSLVRKITGALPIVILASLAIVPVAMTLASLLKFGAASKTYQGVGNYYDAGIPIAVKAAAACLGMFFGFIHDVGVFVFSVLTTSWVFWPVVVIGMAALLFRD